MQRRPDGSAQSADAEGSIRAAHEAIWRCEKKRLLLIEAWPKPANRKR